MIPVAQRSGARLLAINSNTCRQMPVSTYNLRDPPCGGMGERLIPAVLKTVVPERVPGVRIPLPPPYLIHSSPDPSVLVHS